MYPYLSVGATKSRDCLHTEVPGPELCRLVWPEMLVLVLAQRWVFGEINFSEHRFLGEAVCGRGQLHAGKDCGGGNITHSTVPQSPRNLKPSLGNLLRVHQQPEEPWL